MRVSRALRDRPGFFTFEDFCLRVGGDQKGDLIDGVIHLASPGNTVEAKWFGELVMKLTAAVDEQDLGQIYSLRVAFRIDDRNATCPDLALVHADHAARIRKA